LQTITGDGVGTSTTEEKAIVTLAKNAVQMRGASELLRRAAVMHADAAMSGGRMPLPRSVCSINTRLSRVATARSIAW
jgi:hypothetical protein